MGHAGESCKGRLLASLIATALIGIGSSLCASAEAAVRGCFDGRIAFDSLRNGNRDIFVIGSPFTPGATPPPLPAPTSTPTQLTTGPNDAKPSWSPPDPSNLCGFLPPGYTARATMIAFQRTAGGNTNIYALNAATPEPNGQTVQVTHDVGADTSPAWASFPVPLAPSLAYPPIAFERSINGHRDIFIANYDGTDETNLTNSSGADYSNPDWSSGGAGDIPRLTFDSNQGGSREVWSMDVGYDPTNKRYLNLGMREVTAGQPVSSNPSWFTFTPNVPNAAPVSPLIDGVAFAGPDQDGGNSQIVVASYDRGTPNSTGPFTLPNSISFDAVTSDACQNTAPAWAPTGDLIAYQKTSADGRSDIYVLDPAAGDETGDVNLTRHVGDNRNPDWEAVGFRDVEAFPVRPVGRRGRKRHSGLIRSDAYQAARLAASDGGAGCTQSTGGGTGGGTGHGNGHGNGGGNGGGVGRGAFSTRVTGIVVRGRGRGRVILISLKVNAVAKLTAELLHGHRRLTTDRWPLTTGAHRVRLRVPARAGAGVYRVRLSVRPPSGPTKSLSRYVRLGR
jgi:hypothetical protein